MTATRAKPAAAPQKREVLATYHGLMEAEEQPVVNVNVSGALVVLQNGPASGDAGYVQDSVLGCARVAGVNEARPSGDLVIW